MLCGSQYIGALLCRDSTWRMLQLSIHEYPSRHLELTCETGCRDVSLNHGGSNRVGYQRVCIELKWTVMCFSWGTLVCRHGDMMCCGCQTWGDRIYCYVELCFIEGL